MKHICKYFLMDDKGVRRCTQCGKAAHEPEVKLQEEHEDKAIDRPTTKARR